MLIQNASHIQYNINQNSPNLSNKKANIFTQSNSTLKNTIRFGSSNKSKSPTGITTVRDSYNGSLNESI